MYARRNVRWSILWTISRKVLILSAFWGMFCVAAAVLLLGAGVDISLPLPPLSVIGVAVAFYVGFKNNQSYDRFWEARKIWGGVVNVSRSFANAALTYTPGGDARTITDAQRRLVYRHLAWMHALRFQLRRKTVFGFEPAGAARRFMQTTDIDSMRTELARFLPEDELGVVCTQVNSATQILRLQGDHLRRVAAAGDVSDYRLVDLMSHLTECYTLQGKCERIKNTPLPRQYAYFSGLFTWVFLALLPLGIFGEFARRVDGPVALTAWLAVPVYVVVAWVFYTMETVGDASEDPFENFINDVPMTALCRTIEIDLRQMLCESDVPPPLKPVDDILM